MTTAVKSESPAPAGPLRRMKSKKQQVTITIGEIACGILLPVFGWSLWILMYALYEILGGM